MGKAGKARKKRRIEQANGVIASFNVIADNDSDDSNDSDSERGGVSSSAPSAPPSLSPQDIATTVRTLNILAANIEMYKSSQMRPIRVAVNSLINEGKNVGFHLSSTIIGKVSDALHDNNWDEALLLLHQMREKNIVPKLGSLQRWVRDCDAASGVNGDEYDAKVLQVLDGILRTVDPAQVPREGEKRHMPLVYHEPFIGKDALDADSVPRGVAEVRPDLYNLSTFQLLHHEKGSDRRPPNEYDMKMYTSTPGTVVLEHGREALVKRVDVPNVPGAFLLLNVLSREECRQIITAAETFGFEPDRPIGDGAAADQKSVLAHNFFWLADSSLNSTIFERCKAFLPNVMGGDGPVVGINARWRVYRYVKGSVYRPHVDGAWPASGISEDGKYVYDAYKGERYSRMTFLMYLNEDFEGGCTTFFTPSKEVGIMDAQGVKPRAGCILCFPHGDTMGSLLHEGSAVIGDGKKYIVRSDLMYVIEKHKIIKDKERESTT